MKVILLTDVAKIGRRNEVKEVSDGYARNFLLKKGFAIPAATGEVAKLEHEKSSIEKKRQEEIRQVRLELEKLPGVKLIISRPASPEGALFSALKTTDIARELASNHGISIAAEYIKNPAPFKAIGDFEVAVDAREAGKGTLYLSIVRS